MGEFWEDVRYILESKLFSRMSPLGLKVLQTIFLAITVILLAICVGYGVRYSQFVTVDGIVLEKETEYGPGTARAYFAAIEYEYEGNTYVTILNVTLTSTR